MGLERSFVGSLFAGASESTVVMGTRRCFGGAPAEDVDDDGGGVAMSTGAVRCKTRFVDKQGEMRKREHTVFPIPLRMSSSARSSSALTASFFGSILNTHCRSALNKVNIRQKPGQSCAIMGLPKQLERNTGLRSAKEGFHVIFGQAEHCSTVTVGVFISGARNAG